MCSKAAPSLMRCHSFRQAQESHAHPDTLVLQVNQKVILKVLQRMSDTKPITSTVVNNGVEALGALEKAAFDIIL